MGQNRTDTHNQLLAKQRVADRRRCPSCDRGSALSSPRNYEDEYDGTYMGHVRECNYCGHRVGILMGKTFGRPTGDYATEAECEAALIADGQIEANDAI